MRKDLTELVFILDKSGSMSGLEADTIGGFNALIEEQKTEKGETLVSTVLFNNLTEVLHDRIDISKIEPLSNKQYCVGGNTALLDALGQTINHVSNMHECAKENAPEHTMFVIITDGEENSSRMFSGKQIKSMVEHQQKKFGWKFLFLGANIDAITTAETYGIPSHMAANFNADEEGIRDAYVCAAKQIKPLRANMPMDDRQWAEQLDKDYYDKKDK